MRHDGCRSPRVPVQYAGRVINSPVYNNPAVLLTVMPLDLGAGELFRRRTRLLFCICNFILITLLHPASVATSWLNWMPEQEVRLFVIDEFGSYGVLAVVHSP